MEEASYHGVVRPFSRNGNDRSVLRKGHSAHSRRDLQGLYVHGRYGWLRQFHNRGIQRRQKERVIAMENRSKWIKLFALIVVIVCGVLIYKTVYGKPEALQNAQNVTNSVIVQGTAHTETQREKVKNHAEQAKQEALRIRETVSKDISRLDGDGVADAVRGELRILLSED